MSEEKKEEEVKLTPEQIKANRVKIIDFYKKQNEVLELQAKHESLMADIEMSRAKRLEMIIRQAQMQAGPETEDPEGEDPEGEKKRERILKKS